MEEGSIANGSEFPAFMYAGSQNGLWRVVSGYLLVRVSSFQLFIIRRQHVRSSLIVTYSRS